MHSTRRITLLLTLAVLAIAATYYPGGLGRFYGTDNLTNLVTGAVYFQTDSNTFWVGGVSSNPVKVGTIGVATTNDINTAVGSLASTTFVNSAVAPLVATNDSRVVTLTGGLILGTNTASRAPLQFTYPAGPLLTNITPGAVEYGAPGFEHTFFMTTYLVRRSVVLAQNILTNDATYTGFTTATNIYSVVMAPDFIKPGKSIEILLDGIYTVAGAASFNIAFLHGTNVLETITSTTTPSTDKPWELFARITFRTVGTNGTAISKIKLTQDTTVNMEAVTTPTTIDTTITNTVYIQLTPSANANSLTLQQGRTLCIDMVPGQ
jgi:hypothetical protein